MTSPTFSARAPVYRELWDGVKINARQRSAVLATARKIAANKGRYDPVAAATGVPWYVVGIIHAMECGLRFDQHLHNGDPLTARTRQVPKGRPKTGSPPFAWDASAIDALEYDKLDRVGAWTIERICYELEKYNGWGYLPRGIQSPYLWSYTSHYSAGKYIADGVWDESAVSAQSGAMALLKALIENGDVTLDDRGGSSPSRVPVVEATPTVSKEERVGAELGKNSPMPSPSLPSVAVRSKSVWALLNAKIVLALGLLTELGRDGFDWIAGIMGVVPTAAEAAIGLAEKGDKLSGLIGFDWKRIAVGVTVACMGVVLVRHIRDKRELETLRGQQS